MFIPDWKSNIFVFWCNIDITGMWPMWAVGIDFSFCQGIKFVQLIYAQLFLVTK